MVTKVLCVISMLVGGISGTLVAQPFFASPTLIVLSPTSTFPSHQKCQEGVVSTNCPPAIVSAIETATTTNEIATTSTTTVLRSPFGIASQILISETISYPDGLMLTLSSLNDSRCKQEVQCIWTGELAPSLMVSGSIFGDSNVVFMLGSTRAPRFTLGGYTFTLGTTDENGIMITVSKEVSITKEPVLPQVKTATVLGAAAVTLFPPAFATEVDFATEVTTLIEKMTAEFRKKESLPVFMHDKNLATSATTYSKNMRTGDFFAHVDPLGCDLTCRFAESKYQAQSWGENLAMLEFDERPTAAYVANFFMREWEASAGHRRNLLSPTFTHQGIGISLDESSIYVVAHFALPNL